MNIVIAPDSFKESLTASEVAGALEAGIRRVMPNANCTTIAMADGGEGIAAVIVGASGGRCIEQAVSGPLGKSVVASFGYMDRTHTAIVEIASACGLELVPHAKRSPMVTTSYGVGELLDSAIRHGARTIVVGLGGSATVDGGIGMAQALGVRFYDVRGSELTGRLGGGDLSKIAKIDADGCRERFTHTKVIGACDVDNRLCGEFGAARVFGPQKGATQAQVADLDNGLSGLTGLIERDIRVDVANIAGAGAAGGLGAGLIAFTGATLTAGADLVIEYVGLRQALERADVVVTGEGSVDGQTMFGKTPARVAALAQEIGVPVIAVGGRLADDAREIFAHGVDALESAIVRDMSLEEAVRNADQNVRDAGERIARWLAIGNAIQRRESRMRRGSG